MILAFQPRTSAIAERGQIVNYTGDYANSPRTLVVLSADASNVHLADLEDIGYGIHSIPTVCFDRAPGQRFILADRKLNLESADLEAHENAIRIDKAAKLEASNAKRAELDRLLAIGREIASRDIPPGTKSAIIAERHIDDCDSQVDYFNHKTGQTVVLSWSRHNRDLFTEMRKAAAKYPPTAELATLEKGTYGDDVEHREKWSMGGGYFLKAGNRHSSGWCVKKCKFYGESVPNEICMALARGDSVAK